VSRRLSGRVIIYINLTSCAAAYDLQHTVVAADDNKF
jgi:hypothetical protein